jgi:multidrug resistance efflux pump
MASTDTRIDTPPEKAAAPEPPEAEPAPPPRNPLRRIALIVAGLTLALFFLTIVMERLAPYTAEATVQAYVVRIAPEVTGKVIEVGVTDNAPVQAGQVLFRLDPQPYEIAVSEAEARLARVGQQIGASTSAVDSAQARLVEAMATRDNDREQTQRTLELVKRGVYSKAKQDEAQAKLQVAEASVVRAQADLDKAKAELGPAGEENPQLREALAALETARLNLLRTTVSAPSNGAVTGLQLATGQFVGTGSQAMTFIDAGTIWIGANIKENSLEHLAAGDRAEVTLDTRPGRVYPAVVESIGWGVSQGDIDPATGLPTIRNESGWIREPQRFPIRLNFTGEPPQGIRYGSQANVTIYTGHNPIVNALGALWIRLVSFLSYAS